MRGAVTFVLGGARSGKSAFCERLVAETGLERIYVATGQAFDQEMKERIARHRQDRGESWETVEEPVDLVGALECHASPDRAVLVDCLTLWLSNLLLAEADVEREVGRLVDRLAIGFDAPIFLVSNEVGLGIVPENAMARAFRDHAGRLHQAIAAVADTVYFVSAGLPLRLKGSDQPRTDF